MKTNLDVLFKTNKSLEQDGVEFHIGDGVVFRVRRFGGSNSQRIKQSLAKYHKPYARLIEADRMPQEEQAKIMAKVFVESCLISWEGVKDADGNNLPFNFDNAVDLFTSLPALFDSIFEYAQSDASYKEELGNF
jgi:hypothetical protein